MWFVFSTRISCFNWSSQILTFPSMNRELIVQNLALFVLPEDLTRKWIYFFFKIDENMYPLQNLSYSLSAVDWTVQLKESFERSWNILPNNNKILRIDWIVQEILKCRYVNSYPSLGQIRKIDWREIIRYYPGYKLNSSKL